MIDFDKARFERKFVVSELTEQEIEHIIKMHPALFSEIFYERKVNNIYFDSAGLENFQNHLAGISSRLKIRIRWYGKMFGVIKAPVLEIKIKENEIGDKKIFCLKDFNLYRKFSINLIKEVV